MLLGNINTYILLVLPVIMLISWLLFHKNSSGNNWRWLLCALLSVTSVVIALTRPYYSLSDKLRKDIILIDVSDSISDETLKANCEKASTLLNNSSGYHQTPLYAFADDIIPLLPENISSLVLDRQDHAGVFSTSNPDFFNGSNLQTALLSAISFVKCNADIYLYSDCWQTAGNISDFINMFARSGIKIYPMGQDNSNINEVILRDARIDDNVISGQTVNISLKIESSLNTKCRINIRTPDNTIISHTDLDLTPGIVDTNVPVNINSDSYFRCIAEIAPELDTDKTNDQLLITRRVSEAPSISLVGLNPQYHSQLESLLGANVRVFDYTSTNSLDSTDLLIVSNLDPANEIPDWELVKKRVSGGMGVLMLPAGEDLRLHSTKWLGLTELLPVSLMSDSKHENPDSAIVFIVDTSLSMGQQNMALAREIIKQALLRMSNNDYIGIVEFYGQKKWVTQLQQATNYLEINRALSRLTSGGGTVFLPTLEEAHYALLNVDAAAKHIVIITDGCVERADYQKAINKVTNDNISLSTVLIGPATYVGFLYELAKWGNGEFYHVQDKLTLPAISFKEIYKKSGAMNASSVNDITASYPYEVLTDIDLNKINRSMDYVKTGLRSTAQALISVNGGRPLLSYWNYGLGKTAFVSSNMFVNNLTDTETAKLFTNVCSMLCNSKKQSSNDLQYRIYLNKLELFYRTGLPDTDDFDVIISTDGYSSEHKLYQIADNLWKTAIALPETAFYQVTIKHQQKVLANTELAYNKPFELCACNDNTELVDLFKVSADQTSMAENKTVVELWSWFIYAAMIFLLLNVFLRRLPLLRSKKHVNIILLVVTASLSWSGSLSAADTQNADIISRLTANLNSEIYSNDTENLINNSDIISYICGSYSPLEPEHIAQGFDRYIQKMLDGYDCFAEQKYSQASDSFYTAMKIAGSVKDQGYALAWTMLAADKCNRLEELIGLVMNCSNISVENYSSLLFIAGYHNYSSVIQKLKNAINASDSSHSQTLRSLNDTVIKLQLLRSEFDQSGLLIDEIRTADSALATVNNYLRFDRIAELENIIPVIINNIDSKSELITFANALNTNYALYEFARIALEKAAGSPDGYFSAKLSLAHSLKFQGDNKAALKVLDELNDSELISASMRLQLAAEYEMLGNSEQANNIFQQLYAVTGDLDLKLKIAEAADNHMDSDQVFQFWLNIWMQTDPENLLFAIEPKLLDHASRTNNLVKLVLLLEKQIAQGIDREKSINLLVSIYESVGDTIGIVELVNQYYGQNSIKALKYKLRIFYRSHQYSYCVKTLKQLLKADPDNTLDYLYQLALMSLENKEPAFAYEILDTISRYMPDQVDNYEYVAAVYNLMHDTEQALLYYEKTLNSGVASDDIWLSWSQVALTVHGKEYTQTKLQQQLSPDISDNLLVVIVDSLMNINADREIISDSLTLVFYRISKDPQQSFFYHLANDIMAHLGIKGDMVTRLNLASSLYTPGYRRLLFRKMINEVDPSSAFSVIDLEKLLMMLDCKISYSVMINFARDFLNSGNDALADFFLKSYILPDVENSDLFELADYYERNGEFDRLVSIFKEASIYRPGDIEVTIRLAEYYEITGDLVNSFDQYRIAYEKASLQGAYDFDLGSINDNKNINSIVQLRRVALEGMLDTSGPADINWLKEHIRSQLNNSNFSRTDSRSHSLFLSFWKDYDIVSLATNDLNASKTAIADITKKYNPDFAFCQQLIANRVEYGIYSDSLATALDRDTHSIIQFLISDSVSPLPTVSDLSNILELIKADNISEASTLLQQLSADLNVSDYPILVDLLTAAVATDNWQYIEGYLYSYIDGVLSSEPAPVRRGHLCSICRIAGRLINKSRQLELSRYLSAGFANDQLSKHNIELLAVDINSDRYYSDQVAEAVIEHGPVDISVLLEIIKYSDIQFRGELLTKALAQIAPAKRFVFMIGYIRDLDREVSDRELDDYYNIIAMLPKFGLGIQTSYQYLIRFADEARTNIVLVKAMADRLLINEPENLANLAFSNYLLSQKDHAAAQAFAYNFLDRLYQSDLQVANLICIISDTVNLLSDSELHAKVQDYQAVSADDLSWAASVALTAIYNKLDDRPLLMQAAVDCWRKYPVDRNIMLYITDILSRLGDGDLVQQLLQESLHIYPDNTYYRRALFRYACNNGDYTTAAQALNYDTSALLELNSVYLASLQDDQSSLIQRVVYSIVKCRRNLTFYSFLWKNWQSPGGLIELIARSSDDQKMNMYEYLAGIDGLKDTLKRYFRFMPQSRSYYLDFKRGLNSRQAANSALYLDTLKNLITGTLESDNHSYFNITLSPFSCSQLERLLLSIAANSNTLLLPDKLASYLAVTNDLSLDISDEYWNIINNSYNRYPTSELNFQLLKYYTTIASKQDFLLALDRMLVHDSLVYSDHALSNLLELQVNSSSACTLISSAVEHIIDNLDNNTIDHDKAVQYLAMLAILQHNCGDSPESALNTISALAADIPQLQLWYLDALTQCGYNDSAVKLWHSMDNAKVLPVIRQTDYK